MVAELKANGHLENTLVIVTAKHVQSPIDPKLYSAHPGKNSNGTTPTRLLANMLPDSENPNGNGIGATEDDISLLWLKPSADVNAAVDTLEANATETGLGQIPGRDGCVARVGGAADEPVEAGQFEWKGTALRLSLSFAVCDSCESVLNGDSGARVGGYSRAIAA